MQVFVPVFMLAMLYGFVRLILSGDLSDDMLMVCYLAVVTITAPVWFGGLLMVIAWVADWSEQRARAKRIARRKAAKAAREATAG
ncbi:hypothetical protein [Aeromonas sp. FDAARGOS 1408]|uniref:hypothetical protein n=1 Tax=Aeromonas TaxID=642 RepID=UPI001C2473E6|nr:hypothetical protein [Aeromonas sp. FDAARGOS 1408]QXC09886.1 hypothetical protein I6L38_08085 [Aeromonas sp. FDAARGOS 1408]QXC09895.1 hypothetical protein I6L38_08130 [Aeromonas sp. FDAARGOS 1408]